MEQLSEPECYHWLNCETDRLDRLAIVALIHKSVEFTIDQRELYCFSNRGKPTTKSATWRPTV